MDLETALSIANDAAEGEGYLHRLESLNAAREKVRLCRGPYSEEYMALDWELYVRSVSPARIDA